VRRGASSPLQALASSPTMVGAITTLIVVVAVFLAYNANNGLPFVPVYRVAVEVPNASRLVQNNEVRIGGSRVGVVESIEAVRPEGDPDSSGEGDGTPIVARLNLKLDKSAEPLAQNSIFRVRYKSTFGLKYLEITRGDGPEAPEGFTFVGTDDNDDPSDDDGLILSLDEVEHNEGADNGTFVEQTEFDDIGNTFDQRTRNAARQNLLGYGDAFVGRGASLNEAIAALNPLFTNLEPVARMLADPETQLARFFRELSDAAEIVAPVADQNAALFGNMAVAFAAISRDPEALKETISEGPATLATGIATMPAQQVFLAEFADLQTRLRPGVRDLRITLPDLNQAVRVGTPVLRRTPQMNERLRGAFRSLERLVEQPSTMISLKRLQKTFNKADPLANHIAPAQTVCNYWNYMWTMLPEHLSERDQQGFTQRVSLIATPPGSSTVSAGPAEVTLPGEVETGLSIGGYSGVQANGKHWDDKEFDPYELPILHANPAAPSGQDGRNCQPGQTGYVLGEDRLPGQPRSNPANGVRDLPGDPGPTTAFWRQNGDRIQADTRVNSRQP
jgi:ABC-type transporter Mla subunit MlaD